MRQRLPLPAVRRDTLHIVGVGDNRIGTVSCPRFRGGAPWYYLTGVLPHRGITSPGYYLTGVLPHRPGREDRL